MSYPEPPFTEYEERFLLAEIIKRSSLPAQVLFSIIRDAQIEPQWTEIALPYGRSVSSCQQTFSALQARSAQDPQSGFSFYRRSLDNPDLERANAAGRELQPRPPPFLGFIQPSGPGGFRFNTLDPPPRKKRGRPNKEEFERRAAEARVRGEEYPKRRNKAPKRSAEDTNEDEKLQATDDPAERRLGARPTSVLSPGESVGATSTSRSANPFLLQSPQSDPAIGSATSHSEGGSNPLGGSRPEPATAVQSSHSQPASSMAPGGVGDLLHPSPTFPNQETGYGFSLPGSLTPGHRHSQHISTTGGPRIPHSQASVPAQDPYGYYPGAEFHGYGSQSHQRP